MKKKLYITLGLLIVVGAVYLLFPRCKEPTQLDILEVQLGCARSMDMASLRREACNKLHGTTECQFVEEDRDALNKFFFGKINACAKRTLQESNMCTDKYEDLQ